MERAIARSASEVAGREPHERTRRSMGAAGYRNGPGSRQGASRGRLVLASDRRRVELAGQLEDLLRHRDEPRVLRLLLTDEPPIVVRDDLTAFVGAVLADQD